MPDLSFTAFDFETATYDRMPCQLGIVRVEAGKVIEKTSFLIQPPGNIFDQNCINVHHITPDMTQHAPTFAQLWPQIKHYFNFQTVIAHSLEFDLDVLNKMIYSYSLDNHLILGSQCTKILFDNRSLEDVCEALSIPVENHHNALSDAFYCALIFLKYLDGIDLSKLEYPKRRDKNTIFASQIQRGRVISSETKKQDLSIVENKNTSFYDQRIVITGVFDRFPEREDLAKLLKSYGADINTSISKKTDIVCVGAGFGHKKMDLIEKLQSEGNFITLLYEKDLYEILDNIK